MLRRSLPCPHPSQSPGLQILDRTWEVKLQTPSAQQAHASATSHGTHSTLSPLTRHSLGKLRVSTGITHGG